jgi:flagellar protein FlbD
MIPLTRLDGTPFFLNAALLVTIEETPDTVIHLTTGTSMIVLERAKDIVELVVLFQRRLLVRTE